MSYDVSRKESMSPDGYLRLHIQDDGDVVIEIASGEINGGLDEWRMASVEFCTPWGGGGGSSRTHAALVELAKAMALDNQDQRGRKGQFDGADFLKAYVEQKSENQ